MSICRPGSPNGHPEPSSPSWAGSPSWLIRSGINNLALILVGVWMWTFATVILSAGLKGIPRRSSRRPGGWRHELQVLLRVTFPMMASTIAVVATTIVINASSSLTSSM